MASELYIKNADYIKNSINKKFLIQNVHGQNANPAFYVLNSFFFD